MLRWNTRQQAGGLAGYALSSVSTGAGRQPTLEWLSIQHLHQKGGAPALGSALASVASPASERHVALVAAAGARVQLSEEAENRGFLLCFSFFPGPFQH